MTSLLKKHMPDAFKRVARMVGYTLLMDTSNGWHGLTVVLYARLSDEQRAKLAWSALRSLTPEQASAVADSVLPEPSSPPIPPLFNHMDEAAFWADMADPEALDAYCLASFQAMTRPRQAAFLEFVKGRQAA